MPNSTQRALEQARDRIPGQRRVRLPWQQPTLGERTADVLNTLADRAGDFTLQGSLEQARDAIPGRRRIRLPWQRPTASERAADALDSLAENASDLGDRAGAAQAVAAARAQSALTRLREMQAQLADQLAAARERVTSATAESMPARPGSVFERGAAPAEDDATDRAASSAQQAERAADRAATAASQVVALLDRLLTRVTSPGVTAVAEAQEPTDVEIRLGEAANSPLVRAADALARVLEAAGASIYDYSGGHYGMEPVNAADLRRERKREHDKARPVAIIEEHYKGDERQGGSWLPMAGLILGVGAGLLGIAVWQRRRLQDAATQALATGRRTVQQVQQRVSGPSRNLPGDSSAEARSDRRAPAPTLDRATRGELLDGDSTGTEATSAGSAPSATGTSHADSTPTTS